MSDSILTKCVIRPSQDGYKINEILIDDYQLKEDELGEQLVIPSANPFTGRK